MKTIISMRTWPRLALLAILSLLSSHPVQAQENLVRDSQPLQQGLQKHAAFASPKLELLGPQIASGAIANDAQVVHLDTTGMLTNTPLRISIQGQDYPVVKTRHEPDARHPGAYDVYGHLLGDRSLPFHFRRGPSGEVHFSLHTPKGMYFAEPMGQGLHILYRHDPSRSAASCGDAAAEETYTPKPDLELPPAAQAAAKSTGAQNTYEMRILFLMTDQVEPDYFTLDNAINANLAKTNADILANGNGLNPELIGHVNNGYTPVLKKVGLLRSNLNAYGSYQEVGCTDPSNSETMRQDMKDGLSGTGPAAWLATARKDYAADFVVLITSTDLFYQSSCGGNTLTNGITYLDVSADEAVIVMRAVGTILTSGLASNPDNLTLAHELGHALDCHHEGSRSPYRGYCHTGSLQKTIMHQLNATAPCNNGVGERRAVFSHPNHDFFDSNPAGNIYARSASRFGSKFYEKQIGFEISDNYNWDNDLVYSGDFANNSGRVRTINTPGKVTFQDASNSGSSFVYVQDADVIVIEGVFSSDRIAFGDIPTLMISSKFNYAPEVQEAALAPLLEAGEMNILDLQAFPNPVEDAVNLSFQLTRPGVPKFELYNLSGHRLRVWPATESMSVGTHAVEWGLVDLPAGVYLCRLTVNEQVKTVKIVKK